jgi:hypothetical protein
MLWGLFRNCNQAAVEQSKGSRAILPLEHAVESVVSFFSVQFDIFPFGF